MSLCPSLFSRNFKKALNDVIMSRRAIQNMNTLYPDATAEELASSDNICIICREDMVSSSKKLPCGHIFHTICLRSWFQRQQTCPTCRLNILRTPVAAQSQPVNAAGGGNNAAAVPAAAAAAPAPAGQNNQPAGIRITFNTAAGVAQPAQAQLNGGHPQMMIPPPMFNFPGMMMPPPGLVAGGGAMMPPPPPFMIPPPPVPPGLDRLSDEELRLLEGTERKNVEERIKFLRNVQTLLDASSALMSQYQTISLQYPIPVVTVPNVEQVPVVEGESEGEAGVEGEASTSSAKAAVVEEDGNKKKDEVEVEVDKVTIRDVIEEEEESPNRSSEAASATENDEIAELRRRRLERFSNPPAANGN